MRNILVDAVCIFTYLTSSNYSSRGSEFVEIHKVLLVFFTVQFTILGPFQTAMFDIRHVSSPYRKRLGNFEITVSLFREGFDLFVFQHLSSVQRG